MFTTVIYLDCFRFTQDLSPNKMSEILHRFAGITKDGDNFFVQIKENKKNGQKWLVSVFPNE